MVEGKKKRKKLKKLVKKDTSKTNVKQKSTQITKINIKIGDDKKKRKKKKKKPTQAGEPTRLKRRPHLPPNPMIGAINFTPPPGYMTPGDIRDLLRQAPPPPPQIPQAQLQQVPQGGQVVEGQPVISAARPTVVQSSRPRLELQRTGQRPELKERIIGFGPNLAAGRRSVTFSPSVKSTEDISPVPSFGTSAGAASPRTVLLNRDYPGSQLNPAPNERKIAQEQERSEQARVQAAGLSLGGGLMSTVKIKRPSEPREAPDDDESKLGSVNQQAYRAGQAMNGIRTGGSAMGSGGGGGLMQGGGTAMGNQGTYMDNRANRALGRVGLPRQKRGGTRTGSGRPKGIKSKSKVDEQLSLIGQEAVPVAVPIDSSRLGRLSKALGIGKKTKIEPITSKLIV